MKLLLQSTLSLLVLSVITGVMYPFAVTGVAALCCARQAGGSLIRAGDKVVGSALLAQPFDQPQYFWPRPSGIAPIPYDGRSSSGSNPE